MTKKPKRFEEFYFSVVDDILDIDIVVDYVALHDGDTGKFTGSMFCLECKKAKLAFVNKTTKRRAHLRRIGTLKHEDSCSYNYDYASKKVVKKYVDSLSYNEIQDKLSSIMKMLLKNHQKKNNKAKETNCSATENTENAMLIHEKVNNRGVLKALRRKRLNSWIDESDGEEFCAFYGKVKLEVVGKEKIIKDSQKSYKYNLLLLYTKNRKGEWKYRTSIYRRQIRDIVDKDSVYQIVIIGKLNFDYNFWTIKLANDNAIGYRAIE